MTAPGTKRISSQRGGSNASELERNSIHSKWRNLPFPSRFLNKDWIWKGNKIQFWLYRNGFLVWLMCPTTNVTSVYRTSSKRRLHLELYSRTLLVRLDLDLDSNRWVIDTVIPNHWITESKDETFYLYFWGKSVRRTLLISYSMYNLWTSRYWSKGVKGCRTSIS